MLALGAMFVYVVIRQVRLPPVAQQIDQLANDTHRHMQRHEWDAIYDDATPEWKSSSTVDETRVLFGQIDQEFGPPESSVRTSFIDKTVLRGVFLTGFFRTSFARQDDVRERLRWKLSSGKMRLVQYELDFASSHISVGAP